MTRYYAYGREQTPGRLAGLPTDYTFTGQRQDNTGLIYMNARYYDPELGQFISPDTEIPDPTNLFNYNRYMYGLGNPLKYNDPTGHQASCMMDQNLNMTCGDATTGAQTQTSLINSVTATQFGPSQPTTEELIGRTAGKVADQLKTMLLYYNKDGSIDWNATLGNSVGAPLNECAKLAGGLCGISVGGSVGLGGGGRGSMDFYVDQNGHWDAFGTVGGGGYIPPLVFIPGGGATIAHIETSKLSMVVIHNANVDDMKGWSGQFGFNATAGSGLATEWVFGRNSQGEAWHGLSVGTAQGWAIDAHLTATYSWSGQQIQGQALHMFEQLKVSR